jgi:O-antigen ligase
MIAASLFLSLKTLFLFYIFSHFDGAIWTTFYKFIRDTLSGEITHVNGNIFRVFIQSQIYILISFFIGLSTILSIEKNKIKKTSLLITHYLLLVILLSAIIVSFSRSFWVALAITLLLYYFITLLLKKTSFLQLAKDFAKILVVAISALLLVFLVIILPPRIDQNSFLNTLGNRFGAEEASNSRLNQIKPLTREILKSPLIGFGFGKTITYNTNDPRIVSTTAGGSGQISTYAFEWGYLDMILKFGVIGMLIYFFIIFKILKWLINVKAQMSNVKSMTNDQNNYTLRIGLILALISLLTVNIFSPYLNHPLGIGFLILSFVLMF